MDKEEVLKILKNKGLTPLDNLPEKIDIKNDKFNFIDINGYKYNLTFANIKDERSGHAIVKSFNPFSIENIQTFINNNGSKTQVLSTNWLGAKDKIKLKCEKCGKIYYAVWYHIFNNHKFQCNSCGYYKEYDVEKKKETEKLCRKHGYTVINNTYNSRKNFDMIDKQGYKYSNCSVYTLDKRTNGFRRFHSANNYQFENMLLYIKKNKLPIKFVDSKLNNITRDTYLKTYCIECGEIFEATWSQLTQNRIGDTKRFRCKRCSGRQSNLEYIVECYLKNKNISYEKEKRFSWCKNIQELPFDFYLCDYKTVIEVNGSQHYSENKLYNVSLEWQKERDLFKKEKCKENNINYIDIPYWLITQSATETYKKIIDNIVG